MLQVEVYRKAIANVQNIYLSKGTVDDTRTARRIIGLRTAFEHGARSFMRNQQLARNRGRPYLPDGRLETIRSMVFAPGAPWPWPSRRAAILHGLQAQTAERMPAGSVRPGGRPLREIDPHSYIVRMDEGPTQQREYGDLTALAIYIDPFRTLRIMWIGLEIDFPEAVTGAEYATAGFIDWSPCFPDYAAWLRNNS